MKILLIFIILICTFLIGFSIKDYYKKRQDFYYSLYTFCENLSTCISFNLEKLENILKSQKHFFKNDFFDFLNNFQLYIQNKKNKEEFENYFEKKFLYLKDFEKQQIIKFFSLLGQMSKEEEITRILNFKKYFEVLQNQTKTDNTKLSSLYMKLCIVFGLALTIIFL